MTDTPDPLDVAVGARVRLRREALGYTQSDLASVLGVTFQQVQKYERGTNRISASRLIGIARFMQVSSAILLGEKDDAPAPRRGLVTDPGAIDLLKAYSAITSSEHRRGLIFMARSLGPTRANTRSGGPTAP